MTPNARPVTSDSPKVNPSVQPSSRISAVAGRPPDASATTRSRPRTATTRPTAPPARPPRRSRLVKLGPRPGAVGRTEAWRHDAHARGRSAVKSDDATDHAGIAAEACPPQAVTQDDRARPGGLILIGEKRATERWGHAQ